MRRIVLRACAAILVLDVVVSVAWGTFGSEPEYTCDAPCGTNLQLYAGFAVAILVVLSFVVVGGYLGWWVIRWGTRRLRG
jgi:hypothetical protein